MGGLLITILITLPTLETSVVSHPTGTLNTARVSHNQEPQRILDYLPDGTLNISSSETKLQELMVMTSLENHQTLRLLNQKLTSQILLLGSVELTQLLSQPPTMLEFSKVNSEFSEVENIFSKPLLVMVQDCPLTTASSLITGVLTEEEEEKSSSSSQRDGIMLRSSITRVMVANQLV